MWGGGGAERATEQTAEGSCGAGCSELVAGVVALAVAAESAETDEQRRSAEPDEELEARRGELHAPVQPTGASPRPSRVCGARVDRARGRMGRRTMAWHLARVLEWLLRIVYVAAARPSGPARRPAALRGLRAPRAASQLRSHLIRPLGIPNIRYTCGIYLL